MLGGVSKMSTVMNCGVVMIMAMATTMMIAKIMITTKMITTKMITTKIITTKMITSMMIFGGVRRWAQS